jgi:choline dehydrogenase-like flavoprotein
MGSGQTFDVLVVGSGASGGWACKRLAEAGLKVALVDAGSVQSDANFTEHQPDFQFKYRNRARNLIAKTRPIQGGYAHEANVDWLANDLQEPYTTSPGMPFMWVARVRITGGRTNLWGRHSYRFSNLDFKAASHDGEGMDWPLAYEDLEPYYELVEEYVGVTGMREGFSTQSVWAEPRHHKPIRYGRVRFPVQRLPKPDADDHGALRSVVRLLDRRDEEGQHLKL